MNYNYIMCKDKNISIDNENIISMSQLEAAILFCNNAIKTLYENTNQFDINIFEVLGMRNLSGMVGEYFAKSIQRYSNGALHSNLHQDGYPDLLLTNTKERMLYYMTLFVEKSGKKYPKDKALFSPFKYGGIEVKATCGDTPSASVAPKPLIGEQRIFSINSFGWKAHHRQTNNLLGILWDFIDDLPTIVACFYRNDLIPDDLGEIVKPSKGGGRTTSVSIMNAGGIKKMCDGWVAVIDLPEYIEALSKKKWIGYDVKGN